ncbi:MAG: T9SS type A sorting domain-containing protein [Bacteroidota bacterium]
MKKKLLPLIFILSIQYSFSQNKRANVWYFGSQAGIDFNSGSAVALNNSAMNATEGCATMCDTSGSLMFYTNGFNVWDRNHNQMPNGTGLLGGSSSSQSSLIVPDPGNLNQYYIFTTASDNSGGLTYSMVDMTLNAGNGNITTLNTPLVTPVGEKLTGFQKPGSNDIWVLTHEWGTANFYAYLVTAAGLNAPVITSVGQVHSGPDNAIGYMKMSPNGDKLCLAQSRNNNFELFDFDALTGIVSNPLILPATFFTYGIEFSQDGTILYAAEFSNKIYQFDLSLGSGAAIIASQLLLLPTPVGTEIGALQMAPDGKIYVCKNGGNFCGVINNPGTLGQGCNYVDNGFNIAPHSGIEGLPNFVQSIFTQAPATPIALFNTPDNHICPGTCTNFTNLSVNGVSYLWSFAGANPSTSTDVDPGNICYNTPGSYSVELITSNAIGSDTLTLNNFITVYPNPAPQGISQSGDTLIANTGANAYQWYLNGNVIPGATNSFFVAQSVGDYNVVATDANGCEVEAAIFDVIAGLTPAISKGEGVTAYPNPVHGFLSISLPSYFYGKTFLKIADVIGKNVFAKTISNQITSLDLKDLSEGVYILTIDNGGTRMIKKIEVN